MVSYSFERYVKENCRTSLLDGVRKKLKENAKSIFETGKESVVLGMDAIDIRKVRAVNRPGTEVIFLVEIMVGHHISQKLYALCTGNLLCKLQDLKVHDVLLNQPDGNRFDWLDDQLIPEIPYNQLDDVAWSFLKEYYPEALVYPKKNVDLLRRGEKTMAINPYCLAETLHLHVLEHQIKKDLSVFGQVYFQNAQATLYDAASGKSFMKSVQAGTIILDPEMEKKRNLGAANNTVVHECVHWVMHAKAFWLQKLYQPDKKYISCVNHSLSRIEKQANQLTPRIQLPKTLVMEKMLEYKMQFPKKYRFESPNEVMPYVIKQLANDFKVSKQAVKIRLLQLGFHEAEGAYVYMDDHYLKPYTFQKGSIGEHQTFSISMQDAAILRKKNKEFRKVTNTGNYLFVDNHFVFYDEKYVRPNSVGRLELTHYALNHMDECCLSFEVWYRNHFTEETSCYYGYHRNFDDIKIQVAFRNEFTAKSKPEQIARRKEMREEEKKIRLQMTDNPKQCMKLLLKWRNMDYTSLADEIPISAKTISRMVTGQKAPKIVNAALICFGLHLPPDISHKLIEVFGIKLNTANNDTHYWLNEALTLKYPEPVDDILDYLADYGVEIKREDDDA